ncbi:MAG: M1 family aminopeptidase, partial [Longimicrobiales bacterium]
LGLVLALCMALRMTAGLLVGVGMGYPDFEIGLYLQILFGIQLADYLLLALLVLVLHVVVNQKHVGHVVVLLTLICIIAARGNEIGHGLLVYGFDPGWSYTDMRGFGPVLGPWLWFKLYWAAWALLLAVVAVLLWVRGREGGIGVRLRMARRRFTRPTAGTAAAVVVLILTSGGSIFYNTNVLNEHSTASDRMERRAEYERRYGRYAGIPQPRLTGTDLNVEIYPERRGVDIRGTYHLVNNSTVPIDSVHLATVSAVETVGVEFDRPAAIVLADEDLGHRIYALEEPLQPGDSLRLSFEVHFKPRGFRNRGIDASVVANGTYFTNRWLPALGYQPNRELRNAWDRRAHGLSPRPAIPSLYDIEARQNATGTERIAFEAVVGTDERQIAVAPGALIRTWTEGGRSYFHYSTDVPIGNEYAFFSADYAVHEGRWNDVAIQIFHHPGHAANLDRMVRSVRASLSHYSEQFGPYPYGHIRLVEHPGHGLGMHAEATTIDYREGFSLLNPEDGPRGLDLPFYVVAHEVAHQWWGAQLALTRPIEGAALLTESLASYSAYQVVEDTYGPEHLRRILSQLRGRYQIPHSRAAVPLLQANDAFLAYRKGPFAMYALSKYLGEERVNGALRRMLEEHRSGAPPLLTSLDLHRELQAITPDSFQYLLHDLFEANTFWELETERATAEQTEAGTWQVTLDVQARKVVVDSAGVETPVPMDDWVEIGVYAPAEEGNGLGEPLYMQMHRIRSAKQTITVTVPRKPAHAGIDPYHLLIDWEMDDNIDEVKIES